MSQAILLILFTGCGETKLPPNGRSSSETSDSEPVDVVSCGSEWEEGEEGVWYDPVACVAWSPASDVVTWHEAVDSAEAISGGCSETCDEDDSNNYCVNLSLGGLTNWRVPTISEIENLATRQPPFESILHDLWSINSDSMNNLAWTANLDQPGMSVLLEKNSQAHVRCVAD
ncbi:MAG: DUF1566 domain-containing protein [Myxococcota bacterium]|nr:DUF1566 domain-containing protein [Myxococcota bacterium]